MELENESVSLLAIAMKVHSNLSRVKKYPDLCTNSLTAARKILSLEKQSY